MWSLTGWEETLPKSKNRNKIILNLGSPCSKCLFSNRRAERANLNMQGSLENIRAVFFSVCPSDSYLILFCVCGERITIPFAWTNQWSARQIGFLSTCGSNKTIETNFQTTPLQLCPSFDLEGPKMILVFSWTSQEDLFQIRRVDTCVVDTCKTDKIK